MRTKAKVTTETRAGTMSTLRAVAGAVLVAFALYAVLAMPGFVSDRDSTVPAQGHEARR